VGSTIFLLRDIPPLPQRPKSASLQRILRPARSDPAPHSTPARGSEFFPLYTSPRISFSPSCWAKADLIPACPPADYGLPDSFFPLFSRTPSPQQALIPFFGRADSFSSASRTPRFRTRSDLDRSYLSFEESACSILGCRDSSGPLASLCYPPVGKCTTGFSVCSPRPLPNRPCPFLLPLRSPPPRLQGSTRP